MATQRNGLFTIAAIILCGSLLLALPACETITHEQQRAALQVAEDGVESAEAAIALVEAQLQALPPEVRASNPDLIADLEARLVAAHDKAAEAKAIANAVKAGMDANPDDPFAGATAVGTAVSTALPPPWNLIVLLGLPLVGSLYQAVRKTREASANRQQAQQAEAQAREAEEQAKRIVTAVEVAKDAAGAVNFADAETKARLNTVLTAKDKTVIDGVQGKKAA